MQTLTSSLLEMAIGRQHETFFSAVILKKIYYPKWILAYGGKQMNFFKTLSSSDILILELRNE